MKVRRTRSTLQAANVISFYFEEADWCPRTWDGWLCWPDSPPGSVQEKLCPLYSFSSMKSCSEGKSYFTDVNTRVFSNIYLFWFFLYDLRVLVV